jgi:peptidoglycan-associated lipoprotein
MLPLALNAIKVSSHRIVTRGLILVVALWLSACSSVSLDDKSGSQGPAPISSAQPSTSKGQGVPSSSVARVDLAPTKSPVEDATLTRVIYFDYDSNIIKDEYRSAIEAHARRLMADHSKKIVIEGHTDERGGREYNLALGQRRADAVQKALTLLGVSPDQIEAVSFGKERPAVDGAGEDVWAKTRRAVIKDS